RAVGVEYRSPRGLEAARCRGEVVVSGGVYGSPQLLLLSGIGPAAHLKEKGIAVLRDLPAVRAKPAGPFNSYRALRPRKARTLNDLASSRPRKVFAGLQYVLARSGPLAGISTLAGILVRSAPRFDRPDLQMNIFLWSIDKRDRHGVWAHKWPGFTISPVHLRPEGRGRLSLRSPDPVTPPRIEFKFLQTEHDIDAMLYGMRLARKIAAQPALKPYILAEVQPGP